jgi:excisionase family DNA binding protein
MKKTTSTHSSSLLSISEVAWLLGVSNSHVCRAIRVGTLPAVRRGRRLLVPAHALVHLADSDDPCGDPEQTRPTGRGDAR